MNKMISFKYLTMFLLFLMFATLIVLVGIPEGSMKSQGVIPIFIRSDQKIVDVILKNSSDKEVTEAYHIEYSQKKDGPIKYMITPKRGSERFYGTIVFVKEEYTTIQLLQNQCINLYNDFANRINNWSLKRVKGKSHGFLRIQYPTILNKNL